jgi:acetyl esterase/lipase
MREHRHRSIVRRLLCTSAAAVAAVLLATASAHTPARERDPKREVGPTRDTIQPSAAMPPTVWVPVAGRPVGVIVYLHGGAWVAGSPAAANIHPAVGDLVAAGWSILSVGYRLAPAYTIEAMRADVAAAVSAARARTTGPVIVAGHSAGGHLAAWSAVTGVDVDGVIALAAPIDLMQAYRTDGNIFGYRIADLVAVALGCTATCTDDMLAAGSVHTHLDRWDPPMLLVHGTDDEVVPYAHTVTAAAVAGRDGARVQTVPVVGVGHSLDRYPADRIAAFAASVAAAFGTGSATSR